jgi:hypothetical protein
MHLPPSGFALLGPDIAAPTRACHARIETNWTLRYTGRPAGAGRQDAYGQIPPVGRPNAL